MIEKVLTPRQRIAWKIVATLTITISLVHSGVCVMERVLLGPTCDGESRPCVFGPGIVGSQKCSLYSHRWGECEPLKEPNGR